MSGRRTGRELYKPGKGDRIHPAPATMALAIRSNRNAAALHFHPIALKKTHLCHGIPSYLRCN